MAYWFLIERKENWEVDRREGFRRFGIARSKISLAAKIKKGDLLIFYVSSGISKLADVREANKDGIEKLPMGGDYDTAFPSCILTRPYITLERENWIPLRPLIERLSFIDTTKDWRQNLRNSLRLLSDADGALLLTSMRRESLKQNKKE